MPEAIQAGLVHDVYGVLASRNRLQSAVLTREILKNKFQIVLGGGRRDEEKARAKEKIFSLRSVNGGWDPQQQRPEFGELFNLNLNINNDQLNDDQHFRVFPLSHWTELDIWNYILQEKIAVRS